MRGRSWPIAGCRVDWFDVRYPVHGGINPTLMDWWVEMRLVRAVAVLSFVVGLAGCGGVPGEEASPAQVQVTMPDVVGRPLDVALSDITRAGFASQVEVLGGGKLGVIDQANWTVCERLPEPAQAVDATPRLIVERSCGDDPAEPTDAESGPATALPEQVPDVVGQRLDAALDALNSSGVPSSNVTYADVRDGKPIVLKSNWTVVEQSGTAAALVLGVEKERDSDGPDVEQVEEKKDSAKSPGAQRKLVSTVEAARGTYAKAKTDLRRSKVLRDRNRKLVAAGTNAKSWRGTITDVGANGEGKAYVEIEIADGITVGTWNNALSDIGDDTLIPESSPLYDVLLELEPGDEVVFSGKFLRDFEPSNLTEYFAIETPEFVMKFTSIKAA